MPSSPSAPVVPGYRLEELLGRGGSGEVWRAVPRSGGPPVAVKLLVAGDAERQAREAALLGELDHPHLVRLHEVVHEPRRGGPPRVALVLDLLAGGSLAALLARRGRVIDLFSVSWNLLPAGSRVTVGLLGAIIGSHYSRALNALAFLAAGVALLVYAQDLVCAAVSA